MSFIIELKRGLRADLPASDTHLGQPYFCTDTNELFIWDGTTMAQVSGGTSTFASLVGGMNTSADFVVGSGAQLQPSGSGVINATEINGVPFTGTNPALGKIPIAQGDGTAAWADPLVQGVYAPGTRTDTGGISGGAINPVLVGGSDYSGTPELRNIKVDSSGNIYVAGTVAFSNTTIAVTNAGIFATQATLAAETTKVIGTVNQGTSPWVVSGSVTVNAGTNLNTSTLALESGGNLAAAKSDLDTLAGTVSSGKVVVAPTKPIIVQRAQGVTGGAATTQTATFTNPVTGGNSILVFATCSAAAIPTLADNLNLTSAYNIIASGGAAPGFVLALVKSAAAGSTTITVTAGSGAIALQAYEISGVAADGKAYDYYLSGNTTGSSTLNSAVAVTQPNTIVFSFLGTSTTLTNYRTADGLITVPSNPYPVVFDANNLTPSGGAALANFYAYSVRAQGGLGYQSIQNLGASKAFSAATIAIRGDAIALSFPPVGAIDSYPYSVVSTLCQTPATDAAGSYTQFTDNGQGFAAYTSRAVFNGASWDRERTPTTFKTAQATASGNTAVWTPTTGKKFRLMRYRVQITGNAATSSGGVVTVSLQDSATALGFAHDVYVPASGGTTMQGYDSGWIDLGNGFLSAAANNVLNVNLSATITGNVRVQVAGTEE